MLDFTALDHSIMSPPGSLVDTPIASANLPAAAGGDVVDVPPWDYYDDEIDFDGFDFDGDEDDEDDLGDDNYIPVKTKMAWVN